MSFVYSVVEYKPLSFDRWYVYPDWAYALGWLLTLSSILLVPARPNVCWEKKPETGEDEDTFINYINAYLVQSPWKWTGKEQFQGELLTIEPQQAKTLTKNISTLNSNVISLCLFLHGADTNLPLTCKQRSKTRGGRLSQEQQKLNHCISRNHKTYSCVLRTYNQSTLLVKSVLIIYLTLTWIWLLSVLTRLHYKQL